jgi:hypothetical protein
VASWLAVTALICSSAVARAQTGDAGPGAPSLEPADPHATPAPVNGPNAEAAQPAGTEPGATGTGFPKALTPRQTLPENLQGWLRERNRRHPAMMARPPVPPTPSGAAEPPVEPDIEGYRRRLRSFDEHGVTVLSNRHTEPAPPLARIQAAPAVAAPVPGVSEPEPEVPSFTETRSLRATRAKPRQVVSDPGLGWPVFAVPVAAISLALLWLRKRRAAE